MGQKALQALNFLQSVNPNTCIISAGINNRYGHPNKDILNRLHTYCNQVISTQDYGAIDQIINNNKLW